MPEVDLDWSDTNFKAALLMMIINPFYFNLVSKNFQLSCYHFYYPFL